MGCHIQKRKGRFRVKGVGDRWTTKEKAREQQKKAGRDLRGWASRKLADRGGEGSRGGQVIGHTRSGKPIYAPRDGHPDASSSDLAHRGQAFAGEHAAGYTRADHHDAHRTILEAAKQARAEGRSSHAFHLGAVASGHRQIARGQDAYGARITRGGN